MVGSGSDGEGDRNNRPDGNDGNWRQPNNYPGGDRDKYYPGAGGERDKYYPGAGGDRDKYYPGGDRDKYYPGERDKYHGDGGGDRPPPGRPDRDRDHPYNRFPMDRPFPDDYGMDRYPPGRPVVDRERDRFPNRDGHFPGPHMYPMGDIPDEYGKLKIQLFMF